MIIEVHGAGFRNKGAELMLRTTVAELSRRLPNPTFAVDPTVGPFEQRGELGLRQIVPPRWWMGRKRFRFCLAAQRMLGPLLTRYPFEDLAEIYGAVSLSHIDALVDVSGFAFSDQWGTDAIRDFGRLAKAYKKREKPVVMLPQGFGPFNKRASKEAATEMIESVDRVYARDDVSLSHIRKRASDNEKICKSPDITLFYPNKIEEVSPPEKAEYSCIIPNIRMLDQGGDKWGDRYEDVLAHIGNTLQDNGENVCFLIHDVSGKDELIAERVQKNIKGNTEVIRKSNPISLKKFISKSRIVVTSRYHGAVAAFSRGVPSICMGWAHKYEMLYDDFNMKDNVIYPEYKLGKISDIIENILRDEENKRYRVEILSKLIEMKKNNDKMWSEISGYLRNIG